MSGAASPPMEREVQRYTAYFRGWCQAFGEHESGECEDAAVTWLFGDQQIGLILPRPLSRALYREVLGKHRQTPQLTIRATSLAVGEFHYRFPCPFEERALAVLQSMLTASRQLHLYLSYHFVYPPGTRIITLSHNKPMHIIYKEMAPMRIRLQSDNAGTHDSAPALLA